MDEQLRKLIKLNEKKRECRDNNCQFIVLDEFGFIDLERDIPKPITIKPVSSSREKATPRSKTEDKDSVIGGLNGRTQR